jgi:hypothetical protein
LPVWYPRAFKFKELKKLNKNKFKFFKKRNGLFSFILFKFVIVVT